MMTAGAAPEPAGPTVDDVPVDLGPDLSAGQHGGPAGDWLSPARAAAAARTVVAAWLAAVNGNEAPLRALAGPPPRPDEASSASGTTESGPGDDVPDIAAGLLHPAHHDWVIAPEPRLALIKLRRLDRGAELPQLSVEWRFTGGQRYGGPVIPPGWLGTGRGEYAGSAYLAFDPARPFPWRLTSAVLQTLDEFYGYQLTVRDETPEQFQLRAESAGPLASTGLPASTGPTVSAAALLPGGTYRLQASFAEHDHKFTGSATTDVVRDAPPGREEAQQLAEDAIEAEARRRVRLMYPGDQDEPAVRPALTRLEVIRLLEQAPPVEPAAGPDSAGIDDFACRYAASRGLGFPRERQPAGRDPGPWFLGTLNLTRSRGLLTGGVAGGRDAEVWYAEGIRRTPGGTRDRWLVARYLIPAADRAGSIALAVRRKRGLGGGPGPPAGLTEVPRGLTEVAAGDPRLRQRYLIAAAGGEPSGNGRSWARELLTDDFTAWLLDQPYGRRGADATCFQLQGGLVCVYTAGWPRTAQALDSFRERAARIAAAVEQATRHVIQ